MKYLPFIGRAEELSKLKRLLKKKTASLVVVKGRRRVGKSRLIEEFSRSQKCYKFSGLAPDDNTTAQDQRDHFALQLAQQTGLPEIKTDDWSKLFLLLADKVKTGRVVIIFDEITWMANDDLTFLSKLQSLWELNLRRNPKIICILCGSVSSWIEKNILSSTGFYGRISEILTLKELSLFNCNKLLTCLGFKRSNYEKFMILAITGGIPWYIEQIDSDQSANKNIKHLCFTEDGLLVKEFERIFHDLFGRRSDAHRKIVNFLVKGPAEYDDITKNIAYHSGGTMSDYLNELVVSGFVRREYAWQLKTAKEGKFSKYRLCDNYLRFYLKYIEPRLNKINKGQYNHIDIARLPGYESVIGLQFENLILNNRHLIFQLLGIEPEIIVNDNPYFQRQTTKQQGCQIDYLIQTKYNTLFVCEIKFSRKSLNKNIIKEVKGKIERLNMPRNFATIPILIHVNGVEDSVIDEDYFGKIIDFGVLLDKE